MTMLLLLAAAAAAPAGPVAVTPQLLQNLAVISVEFDAHGKQHTCKGPTLNDVLARIGAPRGKALHGKALAKGLRVRGRDGYEVLFSLGELDPSIGNTSAVIATECDGAPLDAKDGPLRLIVPRDHRPARSVRQLDSLEIG